MLFDIHTNLSIYVSCSAQKGCEPFQVRIPIMILFYSFSASATIPPTKRPEV